MHSEAPSAEASTPVLALPNNIVVVRTAAGAILVNSPPETLKYLLSYGLAAPQIVLIPPDVPPGRQPHSSGFVHDGINYASVEFLIYSTFFGGGGRRIKLITVTAHQARRLRLILEDTISGPHDDAAYGSFVWLRHECAAVGYFPPLGRAPTVDDMVELVSLEEGGGELGPTTVRLEGEEFVFDEGEAELARVSTHMSQKPVPLSLAPPRPLQRQELTLQFIGGSDGFDPSGITTCFLAYFAEVGATRATLFDAAAYLSIRLGNLGVSSHHISEVVLSHLHEDHMAGLPELILTGGHRVRLVTSSLIYTSLLRVLSAMLDLPEADVSTLFDFVALDPGRPVTIDGRSFSAIYAIHSIPTIAVRVNQLCYSGDMRYDESWFDDLEERGVLSHERHNELVHFAEGASVLVQDAGGGPIHSTLTPALLKALAAKSQRIVFAHTSKHTLPDEDQSWFERVEFAGSGHIVGMGAPVGDEEDVEIFETLSACPLFSRLPVNERIELAGRASLTHWQAGQAIVREGEQFDGRVYVVHSGLVEVLIDGRLRQVLGRGNSIGERGALSNLPRSATMIARGSGSLVTMDEGGFAEVSARLGLETAFARAEWLMKLPGFEQLPWASALDLALDFSPMLLQPGEQLFAFGEPGHEAYLLIRGSIEIADDPNHRTAILDQPGAFFGGRALLFGALRNATARATSTAEVWALPAHTLQRLNILYPGLVLHLRTIEAGR